jgi:hypothetical protein
VIERRLKAVEDPGQVGGGGREEDASRLPACGALLRRLLGADSLAGPFRMAGGADGRAKVLLALTTARV